MIPVGELNLATFTPPSAYPERPGDPANRVTLPVVSILRIQWFDLSTTKELPALSNVTAEGFLNCATVAGVLFKYPKALPA